MTVTSMNVASAITKLVAVDALPAIVGNLVVGNLVSRNFEPVVAQAGDSVKASDGGEIAVTHVDGTFRIPDVTTVLAVPDLLQLYMGPVVAELVEKIEIDLLSLRSRFDPTAGLPEEAITEETLDATDTALFLSGASDQSRYLVTDAYTYSQLRRFPRFTEYQTAGEAGLRKLVDGSVGKIKDLFVLRSRHATPGESIAFVSRAIKLVIRRLAQPLPGTGAIAEYAEFGNFGIRVVCSYQPNTISQQFTIGILYGCAVLGPSQGVRVMSSSDKVHVPSHSRTLSNGTYRRLY